MRFKDVTNGAISSVDGVQDDIYTMASQMLCEL